MLKFATVFTVAHSITLALALLGVVDVPGAIVEPLIAASIVYVAAAQVLGFEDPYKLYIVFGFGLLHGLGFAGAVTFPGGTPIVSALIGFNLGIELGQAMIIAVVFPLLLWSRRYEWSQFAHAAAGSAAAAIGLFWLSQRVARRLSRASCAVSGRVSASARPASGSAATIHITVSSPARSATRPNRAAKTPPTPIAKPSVMPDAIPSRLGRYSCPITTLTLNDITVTKPMPARKTPARAPSGASMNASSSGSCATIEPIRTRPAADPVHEPPADERPERAREQHRGQRGVALASLTP